MTARGFDPGDLSWDVLTERFRKERDSARADAAYWKDRYERLAGEHHGASLTSTDFEGAME